jgi:hypothetical protein
MRTTLSSEARSELLMASVEVDHSLLETRVLLLDKEFRIPN